MGTENLLEYYLFGTLFYVPDLQKCSKKGKIFNLDKKIRGKISKYGHDGTLLPKKSVLAEKPASTALSANHRRARNTRDIKNVPSKSYTGITIFS